MIKGTIRFGNIKPHGGDQKRAFEEMCFQLFAKQFVGEGEPIRREGSGGDAGLEGYIADSAGCAIIGLQSKFFPEKVGPAQWRQIDQSVQTSLRDNSADPSLKALVVATPREFSKQQRAKWQRYRASWQRLARQIGFRPVPKIVHWGSSFLESTLKENKNWGQLLYWFDYPDFDRGRCVQLTRATIQQLGDRYIPGLHTPTECEEQIHIFLRTEGFRETYTEKTRQALTEEQLGGFATETQWPLERKKVLAECRRRWQKFIDELGDGISFPDSFARLGSAGEAYHECRLKLCESLWEEIRKLPAPTPDDKGERPESSLEKDVRSLNRNGESFLMHARRLQREYSLADTPYLLVSGEAGSGKSHTLAEICSRYVDSGGIVLFVDGAQFLGNEQPWSQFLKWVDFTGGGIRDFLACLSALAGTSPLPGLICVDALNETPHRDVWLAGLEKFATELEPYKNLKLLVSCRTDYLELAVPENVRQQKLSTWRHILHEGLGLNVFEAVPKYLRAYQVKAVGITPLTAEFSRPLMLKTFCEAFENQEPPPGSLSLSRILEAYANRKCNNIASRISCAPSVVLGGLRDIAAMMLSTASLQIQERDVRQRLLSLYSQSDEAKSLYRALVAEGILTEIPGADSLGPTNLVRFTFERVWDYFLSLHLMPIGEAPTDALEARLNEWRWRVDHRGLTEILAIRFPEEGHGEIIDFAEPGDLGGGDLVRAFLESIPWRTAKSCTKRTAQLFDRFCARPAWTRALEILLPVAANVEHPWNAEWLHAKLNPMPLEKRDREWTIWLNQQFSWADEHNPTVRIIRLAETCDIALLNPDQLLLLCTSLAWMLTTTAVTWRNRISFALARLLRSDATLAFQIAGRFIAVDDPYVVERVLFAAASSAIHAREGDKGLASLAAAVHATFFKNEFVPPNVIIRHYASTICEQALEKGVLNPAVRPASFRPRFRSVWPTIWSEAEEEALEKGFNSNWDKQRPLGEVLSSTRTERMGGYGDWGRYEMDGRVHRFQSRTLTEEPCRKWGDASFDDPIARRYILQRAVECGVARQQVRDVEPREYPFRNRPSIERLGKKYQWIAMHEFLGYLSDHYHMTPEWEGEPPLFESARQLSLPDLLDPFLWKQEEPANRVAWKFIRKPAPWWAGYPNPFSRIVTSGRREKLVRAQSLMEPTLLLCHCHNGCEWAALAGSFGWEEPVPCSVPDRWSTPHGRLLWLINSYAVPESVMNSFVAKMVEPVLDHDMRPPEPEFESPILTLLDYPKRASGLEKDCARTFARTPGAWFTTCIYSDGQDGDQSLHGYLPSPPLAKLLKVRWSKSGLAFCRPNAPNHLVFDVREEENHACLCQLKPLLTVFNKRKLRLVWRVYGWQWIGGTHDHGPQRDYWALFSLNSAAKPICLGGGTWIVGPNPDREPLPWLTNSGRAAEQRGDIRLRRRS